MSARRLTLMFWALAGASACSSRFEVLEPLPRIEPPVGGDAAIDAGPRDVDATTVDARIIEDAGPSMPLDRVVSVFAQSCAVLDGSLYCWGNDANGQVGVPGMSPPLMPVRLRSDAFVDVCAAEFHSCALRADGVALCWGDNTNGQLGVGDFEAREQPTQVPNGQWQSIACQGRNTCALTPRGELYCWGENKEGRLGEGDPPSGMAGSLPDSASPVAVLSDQRFTQVALGQGHVCAIRSDGALYCWGRNDEGQLGNADTRIEQRAPVKVSGTMRWARVAPGQRHTCGVDSDGKLYCWGQNVADLLGAASDAAVVRAPLQVGSASDYVAVAAGWFHSCALRKGGTLTCWGRNEEGQLGLGDMTPRATPTRVGQEGAFRSMSVGQFHTCAFGKDALMCWGANDSGQLGLGDTARRYVPFDVTFP